MIRHDENVLLQNKDHVKSYLLYIILYTIILLSFSFIFLLLIIYSPDYLSNIIESILITLYSINNLVFSSLLSIIIQYKL